MFGFLSNLLILELLADEFPDVLLIFLFGSMKGGVFTSLGSQVHLELDTFFEILSDFDINRLERFNINTCDMEIHIFEMDFVSNDDFFLTFYYGATENGFFDDVLMPDLEIFKGYTWDWTSNSGSDVVADITNEIRNTEKFLFFLFIILINFEVPVITEL